MTTEQIESSVKTAYSKYGLKEGSVKKIVNMISAKMQTMGTIENEAEVLQSEVVAMEPMLSIIQSEVDARAKNVVTKSETTSIPQLTAAKTEQPTDETLALVKNILEKQQSIEEKLAKKEKEETNAKLLKDVSAAMEAKGATNKAITELLLRNAVFDKSMTTEQIADQYLNEYNKACTDLYGNGASPDFSGIGITNPGSNQAKIEESRKQISQMIKSV